MTSWPVAHPASELTDGDLSTFETQLREQREFRLDQLAELAADPDHAPASGREVVDALENAARHALAEIEQALNRLGSGRFGRCVDCGRPVGRERLEVLPAAARCMPCQHRTSSGRPPPSAHATRGTRLGALR
jgi:DnaK suppressor protein